MKTIEHKDINSVLPFQEHQSYKVTDHCEYKIKIQSWDKIQQNWVDYTAEDLNLEFVMLDPYVRIRLAYDQGFHKAKF